MGKVPEVRNIILEKAGKVPVISEEKDDSAPCLRGGNTHCKKCRGRANVSHHVGDSAAAVSLEESFNLKRNILKP